MKLHHRLAFGPCLYHLAQQYGITHDALCYRVNTAGMSIAEALRKPITKRASVKASDVRLWCDLRDAGLTLEEIAGKFDVSIPTVWRHTTGYSRRKER